MIWTNTVCCLIFTRWLYLSYSVLYNFTCSLCVFLSFCLWLIRQEDCIHRDEFIRWPFPLSLPSESLLKGFSSVLFVHVKPIDTVCNVILMLGQYLFTSCDSGAPSADTLCPHNRAVVRSRAHMAGGSWFCTLTSPSPVNRPGSHSLTSKIKSMVFQTLVFNGFSHIHWQTFLLVSQHLHVWSTWPVYDS